MKRILIFACLVTLAVAQTSDELYQEFTKYMGGTANECAQEMELSQDVIDRFIIERQSTDIEPMGCLKACILKKMGLMVNGEMSLEALYDLIDTVAGEQPETVEELYKVQDRCKEQTKHFESECQLALEFFNCGSASLDQFV